MTHPDHSSALIPPAFARVVAVRPGGSAWLSSLPGLVGGLCDHWGLRVDGPSSHGHVGVVVPVRSVLDGSTSALKVSQPSDEVDGQITALRAWDGRGMVRLIDADPARGALLLERLEAGRLLDEAGLPAAVDAAAALLRRLTVPGTSGELPRLAEHVHGWPERWEAAWERLGRPLPRRSLDAAVDACRGLAPEAADLLVDHDLHYRNILAAEREPWLAVDPRGVLGDPEFALGPLLWNRFAGARDSAARLCRFVETAGLDAEKARGWTIARAFDYFLWSTKEGLTRDPAACREIIDHFRPAVF